MATRHIITVCLICSILLLGGCSAADTTLTSVPRAPVTRAAETTYIVQRGKVAKTIELSGRISAIDEMPLHFKAPGYVKEVYVKQGDRVKAGSLLAELEMDDLLNQVAQAEAKLDSAQLLLSKAKESLKHQIALAELNLSVAQATLQQAEEANIHAINQGDLVLELAQEELARTRDLQAVVHTGIVSARIAVARAKDQVERAQVEHQKSLERTWEPQELREAYARELQLAKWSLELAQAQYSQAVSEQHVYQRDLKVQEIGVQQAEAELERLRSGVDSLLPLEMQRAELILNQLEGGVDPALVNDVNQARLALQGLQKHLADAQIIAPTDGQVVSLSLYPGRPVEAFRTVIAIAKPSILEVTANPSPDQLQAMAEGQPVTVVSSSTPDRTWAGAVRCLPYPQGTCGSTDGSFGSDRPVRIGLEGDLSGLQPGALAQVTVLLKESTDALWLPPDAIRSFQGRTFVIVQDNARQHRVDIEVGTGTTSRVEILKGLEQGQAVVAP